MNGIVQFRKCTLSDHKLIKKVDKATDEIYQTGKIPNRHIPALPDEDYDLIVGELIYRFDEKKTELEKLKDRIPEIIADYLEVDVSELDLGSISY